jgi:hypothetical protein
MFLSRTHSRLLAGLLGALCALAAPSAPADSPTHLVIEQAVETESGLVDVSSATGAPLNVRPCATCPSIAYKTDGETEYYARTTRVSAADWQSLIRLNAKTPVTVLLNARTRIVTRALIDLPFAARRNP